jgi:hypothetical protein
MTQEQLSEWQAFYDALGAWLNGGGVGDPPTPPKGGDTPPPPDTP